MRKYRKYGRTDGDELALPAFEPFRFRAVDISPHLRLCERCLQGNRRCYAVRRRGNVTRNWKRQRRLQYKTEVR